MLFVCFSFLLFSFFIPLKTKGSALGHNYDNTRLFNSYTSTSRCDERGRTRQPPKDTHGRPHTLRNQSRRRQKNECCSEWDATPAEHIKVNGSSVRSAYSSETQWASLLLAEATGQRTSTFLVDTFS